MKKALLVLALPLIQLAASHAFAADDAMHDASKSGHEMKHDMMKHDKKAGAMGGVSSKAGEAGPAAMVETKPPVDEKTRMEVKDETKAAAKAGELPKAGEAVLFPVVEKKPVSTKSREQVKAKIDSPIKPVKIGEDTKNGR